MTSDYYRFFILFSSNELKEEDDILADYIDLGYKTTLDFTIEPLAMKTFHPTTPNALLKSLEEPPQNTTFVFLTNSRENILSTIVSRCQVFKLPSKPKKTDYSSINNIFSIYPNINYSSSLDIVDRLLDLSKNSSKTPFNIIDDILEFLKETMKNNMNNPVLYAKILSDIKTIKAAGEMLGANMQEKIVYEAMMLKLAQGE